MDFLVFTSHFLRIRLFMQTVIFIQIQALEMSL